LATQRTQAVTLGREFWTVTYLLGALSILAIAFWILVPITAVLPPVAAQPGEQIDILMRFMAASGSALFIYVVGYIIYFSIAFRARKTDPPDAIGVQIHDNNKLELWWTIIPAIFVVILSAVSVKIWYTIQIAQPTNGLVVEAIGHQWYYTFRYPQINGEVSNEMHLPVNQPVVLNVTSTDVIHSFWVPQFRLKEDMVPGLINTIHFTPTVPGTYHIICTEFCGTLHGQMNKQLLVVQDKAAFDKWYHETQIKNASASNALPAASTGAISLAGGSVEAGEDLFKQKCSACHAIGPFSQRIVGPGLKGVLHDPAHPNLVDGKPANEADVADILQHGYKGSIGTMPDAQMNGLSDKDIANLVAFLNSLK
jgi:cytochrome c oxidase subunit 2